MTGSRRPFDLWAGPACCCSPRPNRPCAADRKPPSHLVVTPRIASSYLEAAILTAAVSTPRPDAMATPVAASGAPEAQGDFCALVQLVASAYSWRLHGAFLADRFMLRQFEMPPGGTARTTPLPLGPIRVFVSVFLIYPWSSSCSSQTRASVWRRLPLSAVLRLHTDP